MHQGKILVFDNYQTCPVLLGKFFCLSNTIIGPVVNALMPIVIVSMPLVIALMPFKML